MTILGGTLTRRTMSAFGSALLLALLGVVLSAGPVAAQGASYFGRNKVQYDQFDFRVLKTPHFDVHFYVEEADAVQDVSRMAERWYERFARLFQHEFEKSKPLVLYADHPDFQQTNTLDGFIGEGTGGVTESLKNRVIMPIAPGYASTDHVLGHELVHAFQYNVAQGRNGQGMRGMSMLPLYLIEGMAEYLSVGRNDPLTAMWLRDAILRDDFPTLKQMSEESRFFPYRFGQALWAYIGGSYGDSSVITLYRQSIQQGVFAAESVLGIDEDTLSVEWRRKVEQDFKPLMEGRTDPKDVGRVVLSPETGSGKLNVGPALSPDGKYIAYLSERDLFSVDLFLADAQTGRVIRKLSSSATDRHHDAIAFTETSGAFSKDGTKFAYVTFAGGDNELVISNVDGSNELRVKPEGVGSISTAAWSPDGRLIAFTGTVGGLSDLFTYDLQTGDVARLTNDKYSDLHPTFSPDGSTIAFASDRGRQTNFDLLEESELQLALLDVRTRQVRVLDGFGNVRHSNPQYSPDGRSLYFLSDQDGFADVYRMDLASNRIERITRVKTGVIGITSQAPALSVAANTGELAFSVFTEFEYNIHALPANPTGTPVERTTGADEQSGRLLPPVRPDRPSRVMSYLADPQTGLQPATAFPVSQAAVYEPEFQLDYIGQPSFNLAADRFGYYVGASASAFFSDMLGNHLLATAFQSNGTVKDVGVQGIYADISSRWNWAVQVGHVPNRIEYQQYGQGPDGVYLSVLRQRLFQTTAIGQISYPFSSTRRVEFSGGMTRYGFEVEEDRFFLDGTGQFFTGEQERQSITTPCSDFTEEQLITQVILCKNAPLYLAQTGAAYVTDNSLVGFTSPIRGGRSRFELGAILGSENFINATLDWRRYYSPTRLLTVAVRGMHMGRYGTIKTAAVQPYFLGYETNIRGYAYESFEVAECQAGQVGAPAPNATSSTCPTFDRLLGDRIAVGNIELRIPLIGTEQLGLVHSKFFPAYVEVGAFLDAGVAWDPQHPASFEWSRSGNKRVPVASAGFTARFNVLGFLILEAYRAYPFQRPAKGAHWGFSLSPGW